ncbi:Symplekin [Dichanthelium oligosanthes]|uniref:Symplekin n=1 Tax=Dichanthelium oligosanthes TaxID=888268 RepID=A0A1E5WDT9_9POAL|nr:Symplekin [Dichanthelium oligosanthes]
MEFGADSARWPQPRGEAAEALPPPPLGDRGEVASPRFDSSRALRLLRELGTNVTEDLVVQMPNLLSFLRHDDPAVVKQSIASGTNLFAAVLEEMINKCGKLEAWLEDIWAWMKQFKDAVRAVMHEPGPVATKLLAVKFIETWILCCTCQANSDQIQLTEGKNWRFDTSRLSQFHPSLDPVVLEADAHRALILLLDILQSAYAHRGSFLVGTINSLTAVVKNRPIYYDRVLPVLLDFDPGLETAKGAHSASLRYALRAAFLGFLRSPHQAMIESKDILVRRLRALSPGEAMEQIIRQAEKMSRNMERASRATKDESPAWEMPYGDINRKKPAARSNDVLAMSDGIAKRARPDTSATPSLPVLGSSDYSDMQVDNDANVGHSSDPAILNSDVSPVEKMIEMIGALLAEGERGAESLGILVSTVEADVMADIVIETMKHLPEASFPLATNNGVQQLNLKYSSGLLTENLPGNSDSLLFAAQSTSTADGISISPSDPFVMPGVHDAKRDPRRDPRRLDPRRTVSPAAVNSVQVKVETNSVHQADNLPNTLYSNSGKADNYSDYSRDLPKNEDEHHSTSQYNQTIAKDKSELLDVASEPEPTLEVEAPVDVKIHSSDVDEEMLNPMSSEVTSIDESDSLDLEVDPFVPVPEASTPEDTNHDLTVITSHLELSDEEKISLNKLAIRRIIDDYKKNSLDTRFSLLAHLVAQSADDDNVMDLIQRHIVFHYDQKGHELAMHVLYQLQSINVANSSESSISTSKHYEKFFISLARSLIDSLPASDKSFSKLLCDAPYLPESSFRLLEGLCMSEGNCQQIKDGDGDRVTQGLGTVWSLILGRPPLRHACLDIVLKCAIHSQDEVRGKAVRLVAKRLYDLTYATEKIEQFATESLVRVASDLGVDKDANLNSLKELTAELEVGSQETSVSGSQITGAGCSETGSFKTPLVSQKQSEVLKIEAKRHTSLFFALCTKILQTLTQHSTPSADLVAAAKELYGNLKDASILIPLLPSFPKEEVLPIFPRLVDLPLEKFQDALARILQGTAHTGPALTPAEVLIAIHDINPEKDKVALKKVTDACTACFEQRTVFTQQVLEKSLNLLVDRIPIPLLFMRTVIQALDAFPALVDFVMEILSRLVNKQIWKMPKLWVGFLKLAFQTQPRSFDVLLKLPPPQLEYTLNKYPNLRTPLSSFVNQRNMHNTLPRQILKILGFFSELQQAPMSFVPATLQTADATSSLPGRGKAKGQSLGCLQESNPYYLIYIVGSHDTSQFATAAFLSKGAGI